MSNEEKLFELMSKMYADLKSSQDKMYAEMSEGFKAVNEQLDKVENEVRKTNNVIENDMKPKIEALFDGYALRGDQIAEMQTRLDERLDEIHTDVSFLVGKAAQHDRRFMQLRKDDSRGEFLQK